jgi:hypothetical protein
MQRLRERIAKLAERHGPKLVRFESILYMLVAGVWTLFVARIFFTSLRLQTLYSLLWARPDLYESIAQSGAWGPWSAPLDDVFIHFDFARSTARGYPFEWVPGNGYSSGGTSLLYPFVLAVGFRLGMQRLELMVWASLIACVCVFATLVACRRLFSGLPRWTTYLIPFGVLCVGTLDWSLFSGMEVALFLALWAGAVIAWDDLRQASLTPAPNRRVFMAAGILGFWGALIVATRPEGIAALFVLAVAAAFTQRQRFTLSSIFTSLLLAMVPAACVLVAHAVANLILTGDSTAAGALVKLEVHHPYLPPLEVWNAWLFHLKYQVLRVTQYHFSNVPALGWIAWALALVPLFSKRTRLQAVVLWASAVCWVMIVALNGQVRWQNERYTMPAVAWLLLNATLGLAVLLSGALPLKERNRAYLAAALGLIGTALFVQHQLPRFREQVWFFGRASRNIFDQHMSAGEIIRRKLSPQPQRVLVGDAGAIPYIADIPALDIIGLGGYHGLPFARAARAHVGAAIELIERMPAQDRPDLLAIYPGWWGEFPLWFGQRIAEVPVRGNVICGGASKVLYKPRWQSLDKSSYPFSLGAQERVLDGVDVADILSEREHGYALSVKKIGHIVMKLLPNPKRPSDDLWDAGRIIPPGVSESFRLTEIPKDVPLALVMRTAPTDASEFAVTINGQAAGALKLTASDGWDEVRIKLRPTQLDTLDVRLEASNAERVVFQIWLIEIPD